jgi:hypothetical protein
VKIQYMQVWTFHINGVPIAVRAFKCNVEFPPHRALVERVPGGFVGSSGTTGSVVVEKPHASVKGNIKCFVHCHRGFVR